MDNIFQYIIKLIIFVPMIIALIVISLKLSKINLENVGMNKYTKVLEKTNLNKDTDVYVLKIGDKGCVLVSSPSKIEKIKELSKEEIDKIEDLKEEAKINFNNLNTNFTFPKLKFAKTGLSKLTFSKQGSSKLNFSKTNSSKLSFRKINLKGRKNGKLRRFYS